jgi:hypothetical protein
LVIFAVVVGFAVLGVILVLSKKFKRVVIEKEGEKILLWKWQVLVQVWKLLRG